MVKQFYLALTDPRGLKIKGNEEVLHIPQNAETGATPSDSLVSQAGHSLDEVCLIPLQRCSRRILHP